jgi:protein-tyrosine-phosphatase
MSIEERVVIFVCTSNVCRSPLATHFGNQYIFENNINKRDNNIQYKVISRGK